MYSCTLDNINLEKNIYLPLDQKSQFLVQKIMATRFI